MLQKEQAVFALAVIDIVITRWGLWIRLKSTTFLVYLQNFQDAVVWG